jgi:ClpP class serine protease
MSWQSRSAILTEIASNTNSGVLAFVTGDRPGMQTQVSGDQVAMLPRHIRAVGKRERLSLVLHTRGGDTNVPWPFVSYLREYCDHLTVIVPACANSAGTLLALGADSIVMGPFSELSPIDPTVANGFNPMDPAQPQQRLPIAVEDVLAYIELSKDILMTARRAVEPSKSSRRVSIRWHLAT